MMANKRLFIVKCSLIILLLYICIYLLNNNSTKNIIRSLQQSGRNFAAMEPKLQQQEVQSLNMINAQNGYVPTSKLTIIDREILKSTTLGITPTTREPTVNERVKNVTGCVDKILRTVAQQRGDYWVLHNYVPARRTFSCHESVTYTTHADYSFLDNLVPLVEKWKGPVSLAMHAPGTDFNTTLESICTKHIPKEVPPADKLFSEPYNCSQPSPYLNISADSLYKSQKKLLYPVNVGRNIARETVQTHFVLASDIELYPSANIIPQFLEMIAENKGPLQTKKPKVFPLHLFEVSSDQKVPETKTKLKEMLHNGTAIQFHKKVCPGCHNVPRSKDWQAAAETNGLHVFHVGKRTGNFIHWEPIFIGTTSDPLYDERLSWEGKSDKMTQGYALCVMDYDFLILDNAFLVHKPGIKVYKRDQKRSILAAKTNQLIKKIIYPELKVIYGFKKGCAV